MYPLRWLALKGRIQEARRSLEFVTPDLPESDLDAIKEAAEKASESKGFKFTIIDIFFYLCLSNWSIQKHMV
jgi:hypothetical protein